jgi:hypothetical protein
MLVRRVVLFLILAAATLASATVWFEPSLGLGFRTEPGVETKGLLTASGTLCGCYRSWFWGDVVMCVGDNSGIAHYGLGAEVLVSKPLCLRFQAQVNHHQWPSWRVGENSASGMVLATPLRRRSLVELGVGLAWRSPQLDPASYASPFRFTSPAAELNLLYRLNWSFLEMRRARLCFWVANDDAIHPHTAQQVPFGMEYQLVTWPSVSDQVFFLTARLGSSIKGLSGALFSLGDIEARIGVRYAR